MAKKRSVGVTVIGWIIFLYGILRMSLTILNIILKFPLVRFKPVGDDTLHLYYTIMFFGGGLGLIFSIGYLISGVGILKLKRWGYVFLIAALIIQRLYDMFYVFHNIYRGPFAHFELFDIGLNFSAWLVPRYTPPYLLILFNIAILIFVIYFLTRPKVKEQFK